MTRYIQNLDLYTSRLGTLYTLPPGLVPNEYMSMRNVEAHRQRIHIAAYVLIPGEVRNFGTVFLCFESAGHVR